VPPPPASSSNVPANALDSSPLGMGVTYDPFTGGRGSADCKSKDQITQDFNRMKDFKAVRIYAGECNIIPIAVQNAVKNGQKLMAGAYLTHQSDSDDLTVIIKAMKSAVDQYANGKWDVIALFSVENERVNEHDMTVSDVVAAIKDARKQLRDLGYNGQVGAVETVPAMIDNPAICEASDVVMVNCHAFFDTNTISSDAGTFVKSQVQMVKDKCAGKRVVVTESGWPHQGNTNGKAVASDEDQKAALASIRQNFSTDMFFFNAFDSLWKSDSASTFNAEQYWGIMR
jgi:exo-beta-1,3-glucanase (GH17 family)